MDIDADSNDGRGGWRSQWKRTGKQCDGGQCQLTVYSVPKRCPRDIGFLKKSSFFLLTENGSGYFGTVIYMEYDNYKRFDEIKWFGEIYD